jgi:hypothetical protein
MYAIYWQGDTTMYCLKYERQGQTDISIVFTEKCQGKNAEGQTALRMAVNRTEQEFQRYLGMTEMC